MGHLWANHRVIIYSDKIRVQIINKATTNNEIIMQELRALFWLWALLNFHKTASYLEGFWNTIADAVSCLHERPHLLSFYSVPKGCAAAANLALTDHTSSHDRSFEFSRCTRPSVGISIPRIDCLQLPPYEADWTSLIYFTRSLACPIRCSITGRLSHCSPVSIDLKG